MNIDVYYPPLIELCTGEEGKEKVSIQKVADYLLTQYQIKTIINTKNDTMWYFDKGVWKKGIRGLLIADIEEMLNEKCTLHLVAEILEKIKRMTIIEKEDFEETPEGVICVNNCLLDLKTKKSEPHNHLFYFKHKIPINYDPKIDCPKIKKFMEETLYPETIPIMQEWFGFCLYNRYFIKKALINYGEGDTGKTAMIKLLTRFVGEKNVSGISLQRINSNNTFALAALHNKYANIYDDLSNKDMNDGGNFKVATGTGYITAEYKFGDNFQFENFAKLTFACNKIPPLKDVDDEAYYSRFILAHYDNKIPKAEQDKFLINKLTTEEELTGLLNWALEGLSRLLTNGCFSYGKSSREIKKLMQENSDAMAKFVEDCLVKKQGNTITKELMHKVYAHYCDKNNLTAKSKEQLGRSLPNYCFYVDSGNKKERYWKNIDFKENVDTIDTFLKTLKVEIDSTLISNDKIFFKPSTPSTNSKKDKELVG